MSKICLCGNELIVVLPDEFYKGAYGRMVDNCPYCGVEHHEYTNAMVDPVRIKFLYKPEDIKGIEIVKRIA